MRKTQTVTITTEGRDKGKAYLLTEMSAFKAEKWGLRVLLALENSGFAIPEQIKGTGMGGLAALGAEKVLNANLNFSEFEPLLDEMMECVKRIPNPENPAITRNIMETADDIEEVTTLLELRREVLLLHLGFLPADTQSMLRNTLKGSASSDTQTSLSPSVQ